MSNAAFAFESVYTVIWAFMALQLYLIRAEVARNNRRVELDRRSAANET